MNLTPDQKDHAISLIELGEKLDAVRYLQQTLNVTTDQALVLAEKLEEEVESSPLLEEFKSVQVEMSKKPAVNIGRLVGTIFMSIGGIMLVAVCYLIYSNYKFSERAIPVQGKVISYSNYESTDSDGGGSTTMYTPMFEYNFNGQTHTHKSSTSSSSPSFEVGETVEILVDPNDPKNILIHSFWEEWLLSIIFGFMGVMFTGMGYMAYRVFGKN